MHWRVLVLDLPLSAPSPVFDILEIHKLLIWAGLRMILTGVCPGLSGVVRFAHDRGRRFDSRRLHHFFLRVFLFEVSPFFWGSWRGLWAGVRGVVACGYA